jgi:hypothetical protein
VSPDWRFCDPARGTRHGAYIDWLFVPWITAIVVAGYLLVLPVLLLGRELGPLAGGSSRLILSNLMLWLAVACAVWSAESTAGALAAQRESGTLEQLLVTPLPHWAIAAWPIFRGAGPTIAGLVLSLVPLLLIGTAMHGLDWSAGYAIVVLQAIAFAFGGAAVGLHASAASRSRFAAVGAALVLCLVLVVVGAGIPLFVTISLAWTWRHESVYGVLRPVDLVCFLVPIVLGLTALYCAKVRLDIEPELSRH